MLRTTEREYHTWNCLVTTGGANQRENILKIIGVENELRLSILFNIAAIITGDLYDAYLDREEHLPDDPKCVSSFGKIFRKLVVRDRDEENALQHIIQMKVYSNPKRETVPSIEWLHSHHIGGDTRFHPLPQELIHFIEDYMLSHDEGWMLFPSSHTPAS